MSPHIRANPRHPWLILLLTAALAPAAEPTAEKSAPPTSALSPQTSASAPAAKPPHPSDAIFGLGKVHKFEISLPLAEWNALQMSSARGGAGMPGEDYTQLDGRLIHVGSGFGGYFPWGHADVKLNDEKFSDAGIRYRGNGSFSNSSSAAPFRANFKIKIDVFGKKGSWGGQQSLNLNAGSVDFSLMKEALAFAIFRAAGVPAPRTAYVNMSITVPGLFNNANMGFYVLIENVSKRFLEVALPPGTGLLMKPQGIGGGGIVSRGSSWASYTSTFRPDREATLPEQKRVIDFAGLISQTDVPTFRSKVGDYLDIDAFLRFIAVNAFLESWDSYLTGNHNFYFYLDPKDDKFRFIPWDEDHAMGTRQGFNIVNPVNSNQPLIYWLLDDPAVMARYKAILKELSATALSRESLAKLCAEVEAAIGPRVGNPKAYLESRAVMLKNLTSSW